MYGQSKFELMMARVFEFYEQQASSGRVLEYGISGINSFDGQPKGHRRIQDIAEI